jgi:hypothetical protein
MEDYFCPQVSWHSSLRPEGDREYMELLDLLKQQGVPVPIRILATAGGLDIHDILNSAPDDIKIRQDIADINQKIAELDQQGAGPMGAPGIDDSGFVGDEQQAQPGFASIEDAIAKDYGTRELTPHKPHGIVARGWEARAKYGDRLDPHVEINGHRYVTTGRERRRMEEKNDRSIAQAAASVAQAYNHRRTQQVSFSRDP